MKIYVHEQGITLTGKSWEIRRLLRQYSKKHVFVKDWIETIHQQGHRPD
ncbi:Z-ring formation inhibitor MciZ [Mesobacillus subterraneus]|uniref:Z-ring formation inhibitor MciZ n=1 Tax=Mesobacillus subterraneus TaxID=285983 RepID=A0A3R9F213_9BACI|nr:Z-ring formation inhibitor MciZ [Mesobacillus subterraneus]RSD27325.1 Z-ring formation inhibitor MciZ [Mesobacillus subterraneus]